MFVSLLFDIKKAHRFIFFRPYRTWFFY